MAVRVVDLMLLKTLSFSETFDRQTFPFFVRAPPSDRHKLFDHLSGKKKEIPRCISFMSGLGATLGWLYHSNDIINTPPALPGDASGANRGLDVWRNRHLQSYDYAWLQR